MENSSEEGRGFRNRKKQTDPICCPVCGVTIRSSEIEQHYALEIDRLMKIQLSPKIKKTISNGLTYHDPLPGCSSNGNSNINEISGCPWVTFQKVRNNRHSRLKIKAKKRKSDEPICPVCNEQPTEDINVHVEMCLRKSENANKSNGETTSGTNNGSDDDDDESIDIEGESYEEYEWAGQKRIRVSSLLEGGYSAAGIGTTITNHNNSNSNNNGSNSNVNVDGDDDDEEEEEDLNVDGDDAQIYGPPQYTERNIILQLTDEYGSERGDTYLRRLVTGDDVLLSSVQSNSTTTTTTATTNSTTTATTLDALVESINSTPTPSSTTNNPILSNITESDREGRNCDKINDPNTTANINLFNFENCNPVIESLKAKIREYENQMQNKIKCLICMDEFRKPTVSICCWHVHCEDCWLKTLGAKKICPQCNMITSPTDLRRIYM